MASAAVKALSRLSRDSLIDLCLEWAPSPDSVPYLTTNRNVFESEEEDYLHEPFQSVAELQNFYRSLKAPNQRTGKHELSKRDIIDRIVDGDWRRGLSLQQYASIDFAHLEQNDAALRWTASRVIPLEQGSVPAKSDRPARKKCKLNHALSQQHFPTVDPSRFIANLKSQISPLVKAHYSFHRLRSLSNLPIVRLYLIPMVAFGPSGSVIPKLPKDATDSARILYIALPDSCPFVYVSLSGSSFPKSLSSSTIVKSSAKIDIGNTKRIILEAIPKALSKPQERWSLESTKLSTKSLKSICLLRGNGRPGTSGGAYSEFSEEHDWCHIPQHRRREENLNYVAAKKHSNAVDCAPLQTRTKIALQCPTPPPEDGEMNNEAMGIHTTIQRRFGSMNGMSYAALDRVYVKISDIHLPGPYTRGRKSNTAILNEMAHLGDITRSKWKTTKRKRLSLEEIERGNFNIASLSQPRSGTLGDDDKSIHQAVELNNPSPNADLAVTISLTFAGADVFAGLRELAALGDAYVDMDKLPGWATGERGHSSIVV